MQRLIVFFSLMAAMLVGLWTILPKGGHPLATADKIDFCTLLREQLQSEGMLQSQAITVVSPPTEEAAGACELYDNARRRLLSGSISTNRSLSLFAKTPVSTAERMNSWGSELRAGTGATALKGPWRTGNLANPNTGHKQLFFEDEGLMLEMMSSSLPAEQMIELGKSLAKSLREQK